MIYADNAATTRVSDRAFEKMLPFLHEEYGNASSQYSFGIKSKRAIEYARKQFSTSIGAEPSEITFTSGGSETNSWVLRSIVENIRDEIHIITSSIEHYSVLNVCRMLEKAGVDVTYLPVDSSGRVPVDAVKAAIKPTTKLVSIMLANNETGTIQPIAEIGKFLREHNILLHTDAVQAVGHIPVNIHELHVDLLTASSHKFNGAKGTGILYKKLGLEIMPLVIGGMQEHSLRAGTENVAGIVAAGFAIEENVGKMFETANRIQNLVGLTVEGIKAHIPSVRIFGDTEYRLPGIINLGFDGVSGESLMHLLDLKGICVSTSSACTSGTDEPSHVLLAMGLTGQQAKSAIRISYGKYNTEEEVKDIITAVCSAHSKITATQQ